MVERSYAHASSFPGLLRFRRRPFFTNSADRIANR
jgi:hypothetical protein